MAKRKITKRKITKRKINQSGGSETDYWRMSIPGGTGTGAGFITLVDDVWAIVGSSINTIVDTVHFIGNVMSFKSDMGAEFNNPNGTPGA